MVPLTDSDAIKGAALRAILDRRFLLLLSFVYLVALAARLWFWKIPPYGDEGSFYFTARHLHAAPSNLHDLYVDDEHPLSTLVFYREDPPIFWYRPFHFLALWPAAQAGFDTYRAWSLMLTSLLPPLAALLARLHGARWTLAGGAGVTLSLTPNVVVWSVITVPDAMMTTLLLAALIAWQLRQARLAGLLFLLAAWTKETAVIAILAVLALSLWTRYRAGQLRPWPLQFTARESYLIIALALSPLPLLIAVSKGGFVPGGHGRAGWQEILDAAFVTPWLLLLVAVGLLFRASRWICAIALAYPVFFLTYDAGGRFTNIWYFVAPMALAVVGAACGAESWLRLHAGTRRAWWPRLAVGIVTIVVAAGILVPTGEVKNSVLQPFSHRNQDSLLQAYRYESVRDADRDQAFAQVAPGPGIRLLVVDVYSGDVYHPLVTSGAEVTVGDTALVELLGQETRPWVRALENSSATIVKKQDTALGQALQDTYESCAVFRSQTFWVIDGSACLGRGEELEQRYRERRRAS